MWTFCSLLAFFLAKYLRILYVKPSNKVYIFCILFTFNITVIAREKNPELEVEAKTNRKSKTRRKIRNGTEVEKEKKRMTKTNENRYCSLVMLLVGTED